MVCSNHNFAGKEVLYKKLKEHFKNVYSLLCKYNFYFIKDIIVNYLEIFELELNKIEETILKLKNTLGDKFVYIIGNDMRYLNTFLED